MEFTEIFNVKKASYILDNFDELKEKITTNNNEDEIEVYYNPLTLLQKYIKKSKPLNKETFTNTIKVSYKQNDNMGRLYSKGAISLQCLPRVIRKTISNDYYFDIDIKNCHPTLLLQYCQKNIDDESFYNKLDFYVNNRDTILNKFKTIGGFEKDETKIFYLKIMNGGYIPKEVKKYEDLYRLLEGFEKNIHYIHNHIFNKETKYANQAIKRRDEKKAKGTLKFDNVLGSCMNILLCDIENKILNKMVEYIKNKFNNNELVLCYDGFLIKKSDAENGGKDNILLELENEIKDKLDYNIKLTYKSMYEEALTIPEDYIYKYKETKELLNDNNEDIYFQMKEEIEKTTFKINSPICFININNKGNIDFYKKQELQTRFENKNYIKIVNNKEKRVQFIDEWLKDPSIKTYDYIDFLPKKETPKNVFNSFLYYDIERDLNLSTLKNETKKITDSKIYNHVKEVLCNNNENILNYVLMTLSRILKNPCNRTQTSLIFKSCQGVGKDLFFNWFGCLLGNDYYLNIVNLGDIFGDHNEPIDRKVLIVMNEAEGSETYKIIEKIKFNITAKELTINPKGFKQYKINNTGTYIILTNNDNPIKIDCQDRRFCLIECNNSKANNRQYMNDLINEMNSKEYDVLFYKYLIDLDSDNFDFTNNRPNGEGYKDIQMLNVPTMAYFLQYLITSRKDKIINIRGNELFNLFNKYLERNKFKYELNITKFGLEIKKYEGITKQKSNVVKYEIDAEVVKAMLINKYKLEIYDDINNVDFVDNNTLNERDLDL